MQKIKESDIKRAIKDYLRLKGFFVFYILQGLGSHRGVPDIIAVGPPNGRTLFIEVKTEKGKQSKHQSDFQREIESHGGTYILARSIEDVERVIRDAG